ncbi:MAG TPA: type II toxin-antitoxin system VapC family toxin [Blastocatellia bacterium]|nr:type II toxin-antitoxin system VapC family toxin [Blastocatellia bacterium]
MGPSPVIKLDDALAGVTRLGFDTSPIIYFVERNPKYLDLVREVIRRVDLGKIEGRTSVVTLTEVLSKPKQSGNAAIEAEYRSLMLNSRNFALLPISIEVAEIAADLRARYNIRTPDAMQIAAALSVSCQAFLTNDAALRRVNDLKILVLDQLEL